jgi:hypothetical protein
MTCTASRGQKYPLVPFPHIEIQVLPKLFAEAAALHVRLVPHPRIYSRRFPTLELQLFYP